MSKPPLSHSGLRQLSSKNLLEAQLRGETLAHRRTSIGEVVPICSKPGEINTRRQGCGPILVQLYELTRDKKASELDAFFASLQTSGDFADGVISRGEWQLGLRALGLETTPQEAGDVFDLCDPDGSGEIDFEELVRAMRLARDKRYSQIAESGEANDPILDEAARACFVTTFGPSARGACEASREGDPARPPRQLPPAEAQAEAEQEAEWRAQISAKLVSGEGAPLGMDTRGLLLEWEDGNPLGKGSLVAGSRIQLAPPFGTTRAELYGAGGWPRRLAHYAAQTRHGVLVLCSSGAAARRWALDPQCQQEVSLIPDGRLFIFMEGKVIVFRRPQICATISEGRGWVYTPKGELYHGGLVGGHFDGRGRLSQPDGAWYEGEFRDHQKHGRGTCCFADGGCFVGEYAAGERHGPGRVFAPREDPANGPCSTVGKSAPCARYMVADGFWERGRYMGS